jgi:transposase
MPFNILDTFPERHGDYSKGQKNDFRDAEAIAEAVQRPTMKFVATKDRRSARPAGAAPRA